LRDREPPRPQRAQDHPAQLLRADRPAVRGAAVQLRDHDRHQGLHVRPLRPAPDADRHPLPGGHARQPIDVRTPTTPAAACRSSWTPAGQLGPTTATPPTAAPTPARPRATPARPVPSTRSATKPSGWTPAPAM